MRTLAVVMLLATGLILSGCGKPSADPRVNVADTVGSDSLGSNIIVRPIGQAFSALIGEGIEIYETTIRRTSEGFLQVQVRGQNKSHSIRRFDYKVEWLDADGIVLPTKASVWQPMSVPPQSPFAILLTAPRTEAVDFRMNTRKQPK